MLPDARDTFDRCYRSCSDEMAKQGVAAARALLCGYFSSHVVCDSKLGKSISPVGGGPNGSKRLKVRMAVPGGGKSGGLRVAAQVYCDTRKVVLCGAWLRSSDPSDDELEQAFNKVND